jgi:spore germination protein YaaH
MHTSVMFKRLATNALVALLGAAVFASGTSLAAQSPERLFYYVDNENSYDSFVKHVDQIDVLGPQVYTVDSLGTIWGGLDPRVKKLAAEHHVKVMPLVVNEGFNQPALRKLLADTAARGRATRTMAKLCKDEGYWGIQFDIENVNFQDRDLFTAWYTETANALHAVGCTISIAVVHRPSEFAGPTGYDRFLHENWRAGYDLAAIGKVGDFISLMTYAQQTRRTPPGPVAGIPWMRAVVDYTLQYVPASKVSLGIPTWSEHWYTRDDSSIPERARSWSSNASWAWAKGLAERHGATIQWDEKQGVPFAYYENGGVYEWIFFENARSFRAKLDLMKEKKLRGFSVWVLGPEDEAIWKEK